MNKEFAAKFAHEWIEAWNARDLDRILSHYSDDFEMSSPFIAQVVGEKSGTLKGREAVRAYWQKAVARTSQLRFELLGVMTGVNSVVIHYQGPRGDSAEVFQFQENGKVVRAFAHYS
jgi:hypothetical protein